MARGKYQEWIKPDGLLQIESWASMGLLNKEIASNMGVKEGTLNNWCLKYSEISEALKKGRKPVVRELENAIFKKAKGFEYEETDIYIDPSSDGQKVEKIIKHKRYAQPDGSTLMFLLKNYAPEKYRNYNELTKRQIEAEIKKIEIEVKKTEQEIEVENGGNVTEVIIVDSWDNKNDSN